ncbi:unnamed protein product [Closterium sp. Naga37s-1]|nr:unnamed protein product [Closterium sp. Naga37s-1]
MDASHLKWLQGMALVVAVALIWISASYMVQAVVEDGLAPFILTYICNSLFVLYIPVVELWWYLFGKDEPGSHSSNSGTGSGKGDSEGRFGRKNSRKNNEGGGNMVTSISLRKKKTKEGGVGDEEERGLLVKEEKARGLGDIEEERSDGGMVGEEEGREKGPGLVSFASGEPEQIDRALQTALEGLPPDVLPLLPSWPSCASASPDSLFAGASRLLEAHALEAGQPVVGEETRVEGPLEQRGEAGQPGSGRQSGQHQLRGRVARGAGGQRGRQGEQTGQDVEGGQQGQQQESQRGPRAQGVAPPGPGEGGGGWMGLGCTGGRGVEGARGGAATDNQGQQGEQEKQEEREERGEWEGLLRQLGQQEEQVAQGQRGVPIKGEESQIEGLSLHGGSSPAHADVDRGADELATHLSLHTALAQSGSKESVQSNSSTSAEILASPSFRHWVQHHSQLHVKPLHLCSLRLPPSPLFANPPPPFSPPVNQSNTILSCTSSLFTFALSVYLLHELVNFPTPWLAPYPLPPSPPVHHHSQLHVKPLHLRPLRLPPSRALLPAQAALRAALCGSVLLGASNTILSCTSSLFTFALSVYLLHERFCLRKLLSVLLCVAGTAVVALADQAQASNTLNAALSNLSASGGFNSSSGGGGSSGAELSGSGNSTGLSAGGGGGGSAFDAAAVAEASAAVASNARESLLGDVLVLMSAGFYALYTTMLRSFTPAEGGFEEMGEEEGTEGGEEGVRRGGRGEEERGEEGGVESGGWGFDVAGAGSGKAEVELEEKAGEEREIEEHKEEKGEGEKVGKGEEEGDEQKDGEGKGVRKRRDAEEEGGEEEEEEVPFSTALMFGYLGLFNLFLLAPVGLLVQWVRGEWFAWPDASQWTLVIAKVGARGVVRLAQRIPVGSGEVRSRLDNVLSDYHWAQSILLTTSFLPSLVFPAPFLLPTTPGLLDNVLSEYLWARAVLLTTPFLPSPMFSMRLPPLSPASSPPPQVCWTTF